MNSCKQIKEKMNMEGSVGLLGDGLDVSQPVLSTALLTYKLISSISQECQRYIQYTYKCECTVWCHGSHDGLLVDSVGVAALTS